MTEISFSSIAGGIIYLSTVKLADELLKEETPPPPPSWNKDVVDMMKEKASLYHTNYNYDCSEIADDLYNAAGGKGIIYEITPSKGELIVPEYGVNQNFIYHTIYSDGTYIYDPRYNIEPILNDVYMNMLKQLNPNGIIVK